jgi:CYTH domain-containing protein
VTGPNVEHERRFLVTDPAVLAGHTGNLIVQGYLFSKQGYVIRVRRMHVRTSADGPMEETTPFLTAKTPRSAAARREYDVALTPEDAQEYLRRTTLKIVKARYQLVHGARTWEVDVFQGANEGLVIAECETAGPAPDLEVPPWCGQEVTADSRFDNESLAERPWPTWRRSSRR